MYYDITPVTSAKEVDCGPTCLKMLLSYYGEDADLEQLSKECNLKITGCSAADLIRAGKLHGLDIKAYKTDVDGVIRADRPAIIWWKYCHWCVCCGTDENGKVVICNPDSGRFRMSESLFKSFYSGVALFNGEPEDVPA